VELNDVGNVVTVFHPGEWLPSEQSFTTKVTMGIKAPRGQMFLFGGEESKQCQAIRAFMEQHRYELVSMQEDDGTID
jgi:hypothetical protein